MSKVVVTMLKRRKYSDRECPYAVQIAHTSDDGVEHVEARELNGAGKWKGYDDYAPHLWKPMIQEELIDYLLDHTAPDFWYIDPDKESIPNVYSYPKAGDKKTNNGQDGMDVEGLTERYDAETALRKQFKASQQKRDAEVEAARDIYRAAEEKNRDEKTAENERRKKEWGDERRSYF